MTILSKLSDWAKLRPERPALVGHDAQGSELSLSYAQLWLRVQYTAKQLKQLNSHCIALRAENSVDWAVLDLAALSSDLNLLPIPTFFSQQQVTHALDCAGVDWLIGDWPEYGEPSRDSLCGFACVAYPNPRQAACLNGTCKVTLHLAPQEHQKVFALVEHSLIPSLRV
ncbi:AMP-binding protein [Vibrio olivae]